MLKSFYIQSGGLLTAFSCLLLAGCGGGGSSSPMSSASTGSSPVVPASIEYFDRSTGTLTGKVVYDYSTPGQLRSRYLSPGEDGLWDTSDDTDSLFLECDYVAHEEGDSALPRQRFLPTQAVARSPSGANILAIAEASDGEAMLCPAMEGHRLIREEYCPGVSCGGYRMEISRVREGNVVTDTQVKTGFVDGVVDPAIGQAQQTTITLDEGGRPETVEINVLETDYFSESIADDCKQGSNTAIESFMFMSCKLLDETVRYSYADNSVEREVDYYHGYVFNHTEHSVRTLDPELNTYTVEIDKDFVSGEPAPMRVVYQLNTRDQVTGSTTREAGEDGLLDTADDVLTLGQSYEYRADGNPKSTWKAPGDQGVHYQYDAAGRLKIQTVYPDTSGAPSIKYEFAYAGGKLKKEEVFKPRSPEDPTLVLARRITYRAAVAGFPTGFNVDGPQYFSNAALSGLERRFDLP